jgi:hypothetical protein
MMKELYRKELNVKALKDTLSYPEFMNINIEKDVLDVILGKTSDHYGIKPVYKIFVDINVAARRKEIDHFPIKKSIFSLIAYENCIIEGTTKASSTMDIDAEPLAPNNWTYGFRCTLQPYFFTVKLLEGFTQAGLRWKRISPFRMTVKNTKIKVEVGICKYEASFVVDFLQRRGKVMDLLDIFHTVYIFLYKNIHF